MEDRKKKSQKAELKDKEKKEKIGGKKHKISSEDKTLEGWGERERERWREKEYEKWMG